MEPTLHGRHSNSLNIEQIGGENQSGEYVYILQIIYIYIDIPILICIGEPVCHYFELY